MRKFEKNKTIVSPGQAAAAIQSVRDIRALNVALLAIAVGLFVGYLMMTTQAATNGYSIRDLERKIAALEGEKRKADVEAAALGSMAEVSQRAETLGLVPAQNIEYVNAVGAVAVR